MAKLPLVAQGIQSRMRYSTQVSLTRTKTQSPSHPHEDALWHAVLSHTHEFLGKQTRQIPRKNTINSRHWPRAPLCARPRCLISNFRRLPGMRKLTYSFAATHSFSPVSLWRGRAQARARVQVEEEEEASVSSSEHTQRQEPDKLFQTATMKPDISVLRFVGTTAPCPAATPVCVRARARARA